MTNARPILFLALMLLGFMLYQEWQRDYVRPLADPSAGPAAGSTMAGDNDLVPSMADEAPGLPVIDGDVPELASSPDETPPPTTNSARSADVITITTDVLELVINTRGGEVQHATLRDYPLELKQPDDKVTLFDARPEQRFVAQSGLLSSTHRAPDHQQVFSVDQREFVLADGVDELLVPMTWRSADGVEVTKTWRLTRGSYQLGLQQTIDNQSASAWRGGQYQQLQRTAPPDTKKSYNDPSRFSFAGAAVYSEAQKYEEFELDDFDPVKYEQQTKAWVGMIQHYFFAVWIPPADQSTKIAASKIGDGAAARYLVSAVSPAITIAAGARGQLNSTLFVGPKLQDEVNDIAEGLNLTVDYGIFTPLSKVLFWVMNKIHSVVGNWGVAIVLLTVLVKAVFFKLSEAQYRSAAKQRKLQPRIKALRERLGDDKQKLNMEIMELFKKEKVNPLGGCLPLLVQMPVFFALYWVLLESVELRQAPFMLWIQDLSSPDPFFILPLINGAAMFATMKLTPNPMADPMQQRIFTAMPVVMSIMFAFFQAGLVLYWATNAVLSLIQQWYITRKIDGEG